MMQNAKRMVLVDEKFLQNIRYKQDSLWRKPIDQKAKNNLSRQLEADLDDFTLPDDIKVKHYSQDLGRFLHTKRKLPEEPPVEPAIVLPDEKTTATVKKRKKSLASVWTRKRAVKKPKKFDWEDWK